MKFLRYGLPLVLSTLLFAESYEVTVSTRKVREIQSCILGNPNAEIVRICIDKRRYGLFYNDSIGYGWYLEPLFQDEGNPLGKCACNTVDAQKALDKVKIKKRVTARLVDTTPEPKGFIRLEPFREPKTKIKCVKCG